MAKPGNIVRFDNDQPNRLMDVEITALSAEPLVGVMLLSTDQRNVHVAINAALAELLIEELTTFLDTE